MSLPERDLVEEQREGQRQRDAALAAESPRPSGGMDDGTKRLALIAGGLGALLVTVVGGWSLLGHRPAGIPVIEAPPGPMRVKPVDPGGMQVMGTQVAQTNGPAATALAAGPEEPAPQALEAEVDAARQADAPARRPAPVAAPAPAVAPPAPAPRASIAAPAAGAAADAPAAAPEAPLAAAQAPPTPATPAAGSYMVQLAALDNEPAAHAEWSHLSRQAPSLLDERTPVIVRVPRGDKAFFRLRVGGFVSLADAHQFCGKAKASGIACTVADF